MLKYIFKIILATLLSTFAFSNSYANVDIFDSTIRDNWIHPSTPFTLEIKYVSSNTINTNSANFQLYKYNWTSWWQNIAPTYVDLNGAVVTQFSSTASVSKLPYWRYRFNFSISDNDGPSSYEVIFFIDEPEMTINKVSIDIWSLPVNTLKLSNDSQEVKVKTIWTPYAVDIINPENLKFDVSEILPYDWTKGWWYKRDSWNFEKIDDPENIWHISVRESLDWEKFEDNYLFQFWAKNDDNLKAAWVYTWSVSYKINLKYCPEYQVSWVDCKENDYIYVKETSWVKAWSDWTYARTCNEYRRWNVPNHYYTWDTWDWTYMIQPDTNQAAFEVYCDMSTNWWGWTQYVNIKWNYDFSNAVDCWLGNIVSNSNLECFNPNRFNIAATELYNDDWNWNNYFYNISNIWANVSTQTSRSSYRCLWHSEYMTMMVTNSNIPNPDWSNARWIRLWKNYCQFWREAAWSHISNSYMNYDTAGTFWESSWASRESFARLNKLYFRDSSLEDIVDYNSWRRWSDWTYARDCNEYKNPPAWYSYSWNTWDWNYYIDPDWAWGNAPYLATCNMSLDSWGWTLLQEWKTWVWSTYIAWDFSWWTRILMTYKRNHLPSENYAIKVNQFRTRQCSNEHTTIADYVDHILYWTWWYCPRNSTPWDYNDIITEKIIEWIYVNDPCINWTLHKTSDRNTDWWTSSWRWFMRYRFSNTTVLWWNNWRSSSRCAWVQESNKRWTEVNTRVR